MLLRQGWRLTGFGASARSRMANDEMPGTDDRKISLDVLILFVLY
jgi:hypothetical protein